MQLLFHLLQDLCLELRGPGASARAGMNHRPSMSAPPQRRSSSPQTQGRTRGMPVVALWRSAKRHPCRDPAPQSPHRPNSTALTGGGPRHRGGQLAAGHDYLPRLLPARVWHLRGIYQSLVDMFQGQFLRGLFAEVGVALSGEGELGGNAWGRVHTGAEPSSCMFFPPPPGDQFCLRWAPQLRAGDHGRQTSGGPPKARHPPDASHGVW